MNTDEITPMLLTYVLYRWVDRPAQKWSSSLKFKHKDDQI